MVAGKYERASDRAPLVGVIDPDAYAANTYTTDWIDMSKFSQIMATVFAGDLGSSATVDAKLQQATDGSGTGAKDVAGKAITQLTQAGTDSNKQVVMLCRADELDVTNRFTHVRLSVTVGTATSDMGASVHGFGPAVIPGTDLTSVDEIIA